MFFRNFFIALTCLVLAGCSQNDSQEDTLIIGTSADNPPFEYVLNGKIVGLDIDIIEALGEKMNKKIIIKNLDFTGLFPALNSGNIDIVIAGISSNPSRKEFFDFSNVYVTTNIGLLCRDDVTGVYDLNHKVIGAQLGSTWEATAQDLQQKLDGVRVRALSNNLILVEELKSGAVDAVVLEEAQIKKFIENNQQLKALALEDYSSEFAIVLKKNAPLLEKVDNALDELKEEGVIDQIKARWME